MHASLRICNRPNRSLALVHASQCLNVGMPLHARLVHDWAASWVFAAAGAQHTLQERTGVGQRPAAESGMPRSICYLLPWPPGWCCSRQPCSCGGEATVVWTRRNHRWNCTRIEKAGDVRYCSSVSKAPSDLIVRAPPKPRRQPTRCLIVMLPVVRRAREAPGRPLQRKSRGNEDKSFKLENTRDDRL